MLVLLSNIIQSKPINLRVNQCCMNIEASISTIMTKEVECVSPTQLILDIKHIYEKRKFHHHIPVVENDKLVGIVSLVDFMRNISNATLNDDDEVYHTLTVQDIMTKSPVSVGSDTSIREVAKELEKGQFHAMIIADDEKVVGIVSTSDLIRYLLSQGN